MKCFSHFETEFSKIRFCISSKDQTNVQVKGLIKSLKEICIQRWCSRKTVPIQVQLLSLIANLYSNILMLQKSLFPTQIFSLYCTMFLLRWMYSDFGAKIWCWAYDFGSKFPTWLPEKEDCCSVKQSETTTLAIAIRGKKSP